MPSYDDGAGRRRLAYALSAVGVVAIVVLLSGAADPQPAAYTADGTTTEQPVLTPQAKGSYNSRYADAPRASARTKQEATPVGGGQAAQLRGANFANGATGATGGHGANGIGAARSSPTRDIPAPSRVADLNAPYNVRFTVVLDPESGVESEFLVAVQPELAPLGAAQFRKAVDEGVYDGARFFRAVEGFMVQFGIAGDPSISTRWRQNKINDDPSGKASNTRGMITFATSGPNSRTSQVFISFKDNSFLDRQGFTPFGEVVDGMSSVVDNVYKGYGESPDQGQIQRKGNVYLNAAFPKLSFIRAATIE